MSAPVNRWKLGLFVVVGLVATIWALTWLGMARLQRRTHEVWTYFDEPLVGLEPGSAVKFRGQSIGTVVSIRLAADKKHLEVQAALYDDRLADMRIDPQQLEPGGKLPDDLRAQMVTSYLTQTSFVLVDFFPNAAEHEVALPFEVPPNTVRSVRSTFRNVEEGLSGVVRDLPGLVQELRELLRQAKSDLQGARLPELSQRAERVLAAAEERVRGLDQMPVFVSATSAFADLQALAKDLRTAIAAAELPATAASLRNAGDGVAAAGRELSAELQHLRSALAAIERLAALLERDPGALLHGRAPATSPLRKE
jgi:ABC-type transporter Mla subunit MlaD